MKITPQRASLIKGAVGLTALVLAAGPPMFGIGIALVMVQTDRNDVINEYNYQSSLYNGDDIYAMSGVIEVAPANVNDPVAIPANTVSVKRVPEVVGRTDDVINYESSFLQHTLTIPSAPSFNIRFTLDDVQPFVRYNIYKSATRYSYAYCEKDYCEYNDIQDWCVARFGAAAFVVGPEDLACERGECFQCLHTKWNTNFCVVLKLNPSGTPKYIEDQTASCYYPFDYTQYEYVDTPDGLENTEITVTVRKQGDPFMVMQRLTEGTMNFGRFKLGEMHAGYGLLASGIIMTVLELILFYQIWAHYLDFLDERKAERAAKRKTKSSSKNTPKESAAVEKVAAADSSNGPEQTEFNEEAH